MTQGHSVQKTCERQMDSYQLEHQRQEIPAMKYERPDLRGGDTHNSVSCGRREESILVIDEEEVGLGLVKRVGEVVRRWVHDVLWQAERT